MANRDVKETLRTIVESELELFMSDEYTREATDNIVAVFTNQTAEARAQLRALADYWQEKVENARFAAALRGPSDDEPVMPCVRVFVDELDTLVAQIRELIDG